MNASPRPKEASSPLGPPCLRKVTPSPRTLKPASEEGRPPLPDDRDEEAGGILAFAHRDPVSSRRLRRRHLGWAYALRSAMPPFTASWPIRASAGRPPPYHGRGEVGCNDSHDTAFALCTLGLVVSFGRTGEGYLQGQKDAKSAQVAMKRVYLVLARLNLGLMGHCLHSLFFF